MSTGKLMARGVADMRRFPLPQLCTLITVCMVALLAATGLLILHNVQQEVLKTQAQARFQIYWSASSNMTDVEAQWADLKRVPGVAEMSTFTPRAAMAELMRGLSAATPAAPAKPVPTAKADSTANATAANANATANATAAPADPGPMLPASAPDDFAWLEGENILPPTALLSFDIPAGEAPEPWMGRMYARLRGLPGVERVTYNAAQLSLATGWIALIQQAAWPALGFFALVVALVVGNTLKLMMLARRDEVEILSLVGAKPWFIRAPLFANGVVQGFVGSVLALVCLKFLQAWLRSVLDVPPLFLKVEFLPAWQCFSLVFATTCVAGLAAFVAARK
ncbi:cell division protein FtsX [Humidesulfovibrio idahonensis]